MEEWARLPSPTAFVTDGGFFIEWKFDQNPQLDEDEFIKYFAMSLRGQILNSGDEMAQSTRDSIRVLSPIDCAALNTIAGEAESDGDDPGVKVATSQLVGLKKLMRTLGDMDCPLVVLFDDVHCSRACIQALLKELVVDSAHREILYVFATRPQEQSKLLKNPLAHFDDSVNVTTIALENLSEEYSKLMISDAMRVEPEDDASLADDIHKSTAGNPYFVNEMVRMMIEQEVMVFCEETET